MIPGNGDILREAGAGASPGLAGVPLGAVWVRMPRFIGDAVMIHQALEPLRAAGLPLVAWGPPAVAELFQGSAGFQGVWADGPERGSAWALRRLLRTARAQAVLNLPRSLRALSAAWLARVPVRVGWREGGGRLLATRSLPFRSQGHQVERYRELLALAYPGLAAAEPVPFRPRAEAMAAAEQARQQVGLPERFVVLALGAMTPTKRLGTGVWLDLIAGLRQAGLAHVLLGGPGAEDQEQAAAIQAALPGVPDLTGRLSLSGSAGLIAGAQAVVGNDSALSHLAAAAGIPVLVVFGPTWPRATAPVGAQVRVHREALDCLECGLFRCPVAGHPCMAGVPAGKLLQELQALMT